MNINELPRYLESQFEYPVNRADVINQIGDMPLDGPNERCDDIRAILGRLEEDKYRTPEELFLTILGTVSDRYVGRKYYDDRGTNPGPPLLIDGYGDTESF